MATTELGVAYISIVPETKTFTEELEKASKTGGEKFGKDFKEAVDKSVKADGGLGKKVTDELEKTVKSSGGIKNAAKEAAKEFGEGFLDGVKQGIKSGNIEETLEGVNDKIRTTTDLVKNIGSATGIDTSGIESLSNKITTTMGSIETEVGKASTSFGNLNTIVDDLAEKGEGGRFENLAGKVGLVADAINAVNDVKATSEDWNTWAESHISWYRWMNEYTPDKIGKMARDRADAFMKNIFGVDTSRADEFPKLESGPAGPPVTGPNPLTAPLGGPSSASPGTPPLPLPKSSPGVGSAAVLPGGPQSGGSLVGGGGSGTYAAVAPAAQTTPIASPGQAKQIVHATFAAAGASPDDIAKLDSIIGRESHPAYSVTSTNPSTGDYGIFQFNPSAGKGTISGTLAEYLGSYTTDAQVQANAGLRYITDRYGGGQGISAALQNALQHKDAFHWYGSGGAVPIIAHEGEHVLTAKDVAAMGGQDAVYGFRNMLHMDEGGDIYARDMARFGRRSGAGYDFLPLPPHDLPELKKVLPSRLSPGWFGEADATFAGDEFRLLSGESNFNPGVKLDTSRTQTAPNMALLARLRSLGINSFAEGGAITPEELAFMMNANQAGTAAPEQSSARTKGYTPPVSNVGGVPGTSTISKFLQLGNEAVGGVIDLGAQAAKMGISAAAGAGSLGAGAAAGPAAGIGIDIASSIAKRGVSYGFQMAGIGADALVENLFSPFGGAPRWLGYDYTKFAPSLDPLKQSASGAIGNAIKGGPPHQGSGAAPGPVNPQQLPGAQGVGAPTPGLGQKPENQNDWFSMFGFDNGGWLQPGSAGVNMTGRPEAILSPEQWDAMSSASAGGGYGTNIEHLHVSDVEAMGRELDKRGRLNMMRYSGRP